MASKSAKQRTVEQELAEMAKFPEMNPGPVCKIDRNGTILLANSAAREVFHDKNLVGKTWQNVCQGLTEPIWKRILDGSDWVRHEVQVHGAWILFTHRRDENNEFIFAYGADITQRRRDEQLLAEQASALAKMARFPEMNPGPVLRLDLEGLILLANSAARSVFGEDLVGKRWQDVCTDVSGSTWSTIVTATNLIPVECRIADREYVLTHRRDVESNLVFVFGTDVTQQKQTQRALRQSERMATLGTLVAGVAHELNNPASATRRAADHMREAFNHLQDALLGLAAVSMNPVQRERLKALEEQMRVRAEQPSDLNTIARSDLESEVEDWLEDREIGEPWELSPILVAQGFDIAGLVELTQQFQGRELAAILRWISSAFPVYVLMHEIGEGSSRISEIVSALKSYSYLGQAPIQLVNVHEGLDNTLIILRSKLKKGITVHRDYGKEVPPVMAYGSELNQVWTNLLDNAADAMNGEGEITIRTRRSNGWAVVDIEDNGPGVPESVKPRVFDPFFTTKEPGKGTGLGLSTSYSIVTEKHKGTISLESKPGMTRFTVRLPINNPETTEGKES